LTTLLRSSFELFKSYKMFNGDHSHQIAHGIEAFRFASSRLFLDEETEDRDKLDAGKRLQLDKDFGISKSEFTTEKKKPKSGIEEMWGWKSQNCVMDATIRSLCLLSARLDQSDGDDACLLKQKVQSSFQMLKVCRKIRRENTHLLANGIETISFVSSRLSWDEENEDRVKSNVGEKVFGSDTMRIVLPFVRSESLISLLTISKRFNRFITAEVWKNVRFRVHNTICLG
jgi:hypothetical protein